MEKRDGVLHPRRREEGEVGAGASRESRGRRFKQGRRKKVKIRRGDGLGGGG